MAACETCCRKCKWMVIDNKLYQVCPECKSPNIKRWWDEQIDNQIENEGEDL